MSINALREFPNSLKLLKSLETQVIGSKEDRMLA